MIHVTRSQGRYCIGGVSLLAVLLPVGTGYGEPAKVEANSRATIVVHLPEDATLEIQGVEIRLSGNVRRVRTAPLEAGKEVSLSLRATWNDRDREKIVQREVKVRAGQEIVVTIDEANEARPGTPAKGETESAECALGRFLLVLQRLEPILGPISRLQFSSDFRYAIIKSDEMRASLWDVASGRELRQFSCEAMVHNGGPGGFFVPAFSPDGKRLAYIKDKGNSVAVLDIRTGKDLVRIATKDPCWCAAFSPDGRRLATGHLFGTVKLHDLEDDGKERFQTKKEPGHEGYGAGPPSLLFTPDGKTIVAGFRNHEAKACVLIWDSTTGKRTSQHFSDVERVPVFIFPDGKRAIFRCSEGWPIRAWTTVLNLESGEELPATELSKSELVVEAMRKAIPKASGSAACDLGRFYMELQRLQHLTGPIERFCVDYSGRFLMTDHGRMQPPKSGNVDRPAKESFARIWDVPNRLETARLAGFTDESRPAFSANGHQFVYRSADHTLRLLDSKEGVELHRLKEREEPSRKYGSSAFSSDGRALSGGYRFDRDKGFEGWLEHWDLTSGKLIRIYGGDPKFTTPDAPPFSGYVTFAAGDTQVYAAAGDRIERYDLAAGKKSGVFDKHVGTVQGFLISPDGSRLISGSLDGTVRLWDTKSLQELHGKEWHAPWVRSVLSADGERYAITTGIREIPGPSNSPTRPSSGVGGSLQVIPR